MSKITLYGGFQAVCPPQFRKSTRSKGIKLLPHVFNVKEDIEDGKSPTITGHVGRQTSVRKLVRTVSLELDKDRNVTLMHCGCVSGTDGDCKHVYALIHHVNCQRDESQTDKQCEWIKPKQWGEKMYPKGKEMDSILGAKDKAEKASFWFPSKAKQDERLELLRSLGDTSSQMYIMLQAEVVSPEPCADPVQDLCPLVLSFFESKGSPFNFFVNDNGKFRRKKSTISGELQTFFETKVEVSKDQGKLICRYETVVFVLTSIIG